jgi:hypothetical protein
MGNGVINELEAAFRDILTDQRTGQQISFDVELADLDSLAVSEIVTLSSEVVGRDLDEHAFRSNMTTRQLLHFVRAQVADGCQ